MKRNELFVGNEPTSTEKWIPHGNSREAVESPTTASPLMGTCIKSEWNG